MPEGQDEGTIICGICGSGMIGPDEPKPDDVIRCSNKACDNADTYENVLSECQEYMSDQAARMMDEGGEMLAATSPFPSTYTGYNPTPRSYRFRLAGI